MMLFPFLQFVALFEDGTGRGSKSAFVHIIINALVLHPRRLV